MAATLAFVVVEERETVVGRSNWPVGVVVEALGHQDALSKTIRHYQQKGEDAFQVGQKIEVYRGSNRDLVVVHLDVVRVIR